jgi:hypothetical protein
LFWSLGGGVAQPVKVSSINMGSHVRHCFIHRVSKKSKGESAHLRCSWLTWSKAPLATSDVIWLDGVTRQAIGFVTFCDR